MSPAEPPGAPASGDAAGTFMARAQRPATGIALAGIAALAVVAALQLWRIAGADHGLPLWDPAEHGVAGVALAEALKRGDLPGFLLGINRQVLWPFAHSLLLLPWALLFGSGYAAAAQLSAVLYAGAVLALFGAGLGLHPTRGAWVGALAAALMLLAPIVRVFGSVCMLEMPGALFLALTVCLHVRACRDPAPRGLLAAAGVSSAALFFCKYNYGLLWLTPLAIHEWRATPAAWRAGVRARAAAWFAGGGMRKPFPLFMALHAFVIVAIAVTGGWVITIDSVRISMRSPGNPLYVFYLIALVRVAIGVRRAGGLRAVARRFSQRHRILFATVGLPIAAWFLIPSPSRFGTFFGFVVNRETAQPLLSLARWLDYPRAFAHDYSPAPWIGWIVLGIALIPPRRSPSHRDPWLLVYLAMWVGLIATAAHHYHQPRFLITVAPLVWLSAAQNTVTGLDVLLRATPSWLRGLAWSASLAGLPAWAFLGAPPAAATVAGRSYLSSPPALGAVVERVLDLSERAEQTPWLLGYANELSPALLRWQGLLTHPRLPERRLPAGLPAVADAASDAAIAARIETLAASGRPVIAALGTGRWAANAGDQKETAADRLTAARLAADPRAIVESDSVFEAAGFRLSTWRFGDPKTRP